MHNDFLISMIYIKVLEIQFRSVQFFRCCRQRKTYTLPQLYMYMCVHCVVMNDHKDFHLCVFATSKFELTEIISQTSFLPDNVQHSPCITCLLGKYGQTWKTAVKETWSLIGYEETGTFTVDYIEMVPTRLQTHPTLHKDSARCSDGSRPQS